jgi:hypothetical protein
VAERREGGVKLGRGAGSDTAGDRDAIFLKEGLGLVFVNVHAGKKGLRLARKSGRKT